MNITAPIELGSILAFVGGFGAKFVYDESTRRWRQKVAERKNKIEWYNNLAVIAVEIMIHSSSMANNFNYFTEKANLADKTLSEFLGEENMNKILAQLSESGIENPEEMAESLAFEEWESKKGDVQEQIKTSMSLYEERLINHLAQNFFEADEEIRSSAGKLMTQVSAIGVMGRLNEEQTNDLAETVTLLNAQCNAAVTELESQGLIKIR